MENHRATNDNLRQEVPLNLFRITLISTLEAKKLVH